MARECFCGCGRKLGFNDRSISKKGAKIEEEADFLEQYTLAALRREGYSTTDLEAFIEDGRELRDQLVAVLHRELDARAVDRHHMAHWHARAKTLVNEYKLAAYRAHQERG